MRMWMLIGLVLAVSGCATPGAPVKVTRFHLDRPIEHSAVTVMADPATGDTGGLEYGIYSRALAGELAAQGFGAPAEDAPLVASFTVRRTVRALEAPHAPVTIGIGGGAFGGSVGGGGSVAFGVGKKRAREAYVTELAVRLRRQPGGEVVWEGRAMTVADTHAAEAAAEPTARKLARALFLGFPGESGRTISVK